MANTAGGYVLVGANDDGTSSRAPLNLARDIDQAVLMDKIGKYTEVQPTDTSVRYYSHGQAERLIFHVAKVDFPIVFCRPGPCNRI